MQPQHVGPYEIVRELGAGGMGTIYEARHAILGRRVALKLAHDDRERAFAISGECVHQEGQILELLDHPGTTKVHDVGTLDDGRSWIAMELVEGETLDDRLVRVGKLSMPVVLTILVDVVEVLRVAHRHAIVHRDVKPGNLVFDDDGRVRLIDWGIAHVGGAPEQPPVTPELSPGTPHYMAPEQVRGEPAEPRTDVYALGVVVFEALTGRPPFDGATNLEVAVHHLTAETPSVAVLRPDIPVGMARLIDAMLSKEIEARPTTDEMHDELLELCDVLRRFEPDDSIDDRDTEPDYDEIELDLDALEAIADDDLILLDQPISKPHRVRWTPEVGVETGPLR